MGGLKNMYQAYGATPFEQIQGDTIFERNANLQAREYTPYCQFCGHEIVDSPQDENGHSVNPEWERMYRAHYRCYMKNNRR